MIISKKGTIYGVFDTRNENELKFIRFYVMRCSKEDVLLKFFSEKLMIKRAQLDFMIYFSRQSSF